MDMFEGIRMTGGAKKAKGEPIRLDVTQKVTCPTVEAMNTPHVSCSSIDIQGANCTGNKRMEVRP